MDWDTIIIGAGAAGLMCAAHCGGRTLVVDHAKKVGEKIRISGGGRCNFTNMYCEPTNFLSANPHFCKSALSRYTQWDFVELIQKHGIAWHEKTLGQLFCDLTAKDVVAMLVTELQQASAQLRLECSASDIQQIDDGYSLLLNGQRTSTRNLVVASGGKSIPKMGATGFGYDIARQFNIPLTDTRPALVPLTFSNGDFKNISGTAINARIKAQRGPSFDEALLFTHRGLSGPAILQVSSYWRDGEDIFIHLLPEVDLFQTLRKKRTTAGKRNFTTILAEVLPSRLVDHLSQTLDLSGNFADFSDKRLTEITSALTNWRVRPTGSEGYRTAEVTLGGVDTNALSSKTMQAKSTKGLYFIGEVVDVTGWLGGFNFQWAWSSGWAAGNAIRSAL
ncbi:MAG: NAD(P)/FAD-dependent oxidoreductase [Paracoccaceae bacterium]|nr:NAD(P)/FAD-dependent oxidoreductase [Paracoccaceae bacterium]MDG2257268.1 NAD(P)/FAD-dependent oxidoreductase [Paracoccaceae bacterium]